MLEISKYIFWENKKKKYFRMSSANFPHHTFGKNKQKKKKKKKNSFESYTTFSWTWQHTELMPYDRTQTRMCSSGPVMSTAQGVVYSSNYQRIIPAFIIWAAPCENESSDICGQRRTGSACTSVQSDQGHHCPLTESLDITECMDGEQRMIIYRCAG